MNEVIHGQEVARRVLERRDFLLVEGGPNRDREVASGIQHAPAALVAGLQAAGAGSEQGLSPAISLCDDLGSLAGTSSAWYLPRTPRCPKSPNCVIAKLLGFCLPRKCVFARLTKNCFWAHASLSRKIEII